MSIPAGIRFPANPRFRLLAREMLVCGRALRMMRSCRATGRRAGWRLATGVGLASGIWLARVRLSLIVETRRVCGKGECLQSSQVRRWKFQRCRRQRLLRPSQSVLVGAERRILSTSSLFMRIFPMSARYRIFALHSARTAPPPCKSTGVRKLARELRRWIGHACLRRCFLLRCGWAQGCVGAGHLPAQPREAGSHAPRAASPVPTPPKPLSGASPPRDRAAPSPPRPSSRF